MRILAFTSIRSDYDLLFELYKRLHSDKSIDFKLIVNGAHLSPTYGKTVNQIKDDGFDILAEVESLIDSDSMSSRVKTASIFFQSSIDIVKEFDPDVILFVGDREDAIIIPIIASYLKIPTIHFYGGDHVKDGNVDNPIRHSASKLASLHFVTLNEHKLRLIKMGEREDRVHVIGNISLDKLNGYMPMKKESLANIFSLKTMPERYAILIFHPILSKLDTTSNDFKNIVNSLLNENFSVFCSFPNTDAGNRVIINEIDSFKDNEKFHVYRNLARDHFLSLYYYTDFIIGNSSSGILEAASFKKPAINVGERQVGRYADSNVIFSSGDLSEIRAAINQAMSIPFQSKLKNMINSYGDGNSAEKAYQLIKEIDFQKYLLKLEDPLEL